MGKPSIPYLTRRAALIGVSAAGLFLPGGLSAQEPRLTLLMIETPGCVWCARWHAEVGDAYPRTPEGRAAPVRFMDLSDPDLTAFDLTSRPIFTPTFILLDGRTEQARIEGYPGEDFFWGLVGGMLDEADPGWTEAARD